MFRIFRLFSEYLAQKLVCSESLDFVVKKKQQLAQNQENVELTVVSVS
jgi:hypothetical protein